VGKPINAVGIITLLEGPKQGKYHGFHGFSLVTIASDKRI